MQTLPVKPMPNSMDPMLLDRGFIQRGTASLRVDRPGSKWAAKFTFPLMTADAARAFISKLLRAKRQGLQIDIPLLVDQGSPGTPVVDGAVASSSSTLAVRGLTAGYVIGEQYWLTVVEADGTAYLHSVTNTVTASGTGTATLDIEPQLRAPFPDGSTIHLLKPYMQGFMDGESYTWSVMKNRFIELSIMVEEYK